MALSLANLCFINCWFSQLYDADFGFFNKRPVTMASILALAVNILWVALLAWLVMRAWRRIHNRWFRLPLHMLFVSLLLLPLNFCRMTVFGITDFEVYSFVKQPLVLFGLLAMLGVIVWQHRWAARITAVLIGLLSPLALHTLGKIVLLCLGVQHLAQHTTEPLLPPPGPVHQSQPRVIWIIFDETDQRLAFEQRPAWLLMPEFDRLRSESVYATNAYSPGDGTVYSMPGLISGQRVLSLSIKGASDLALTLAEKGKAVSWRDLPSVFSSARQLGVNTALVGWYLPYNRVLSSALNYCAWYPHPSIESTRALRFGPALRREVRSLTGSLYHRQLFADICRDTLTESLSLVTNTTYGLILLHLPLPHKPGVYRPDKDQFTMVGMPRTIGYFNNLILADRSLGKLRRTMESSGRCDKTWLILSSDHSWRESRLYDGRRDLRVPFLIKAPGESKAVTYSLQLNTVLTHDLILAILRGELADEESVVAWLNAHRSEELTVATHGEYEGRKIIGKKSGGH